MARITHCCSGRVDLLFTSSIYTPWPQIQQRIEKTREVGIFCSHNSPPSLPLPAQGAGGTVLYDTAGFSRPNQIENHIIYIIIINTELLMYVGKLK